MMKNICRDMQSFPIRRNLMVWVSLVPKRCRIQEARKIFKIITDPKTNRSKLFPFFFQGRIQWDSCLNNQTAGEKTKKKDKNFSTAYSEILNLIQHLTGAATGGTSYRRFNYLCENFRSICVVRWVTEETLLASGLHCASCSVWT